MTDVATAAKIWFVLWLVSQVTIVIGIFATVSLRKELQRALEREAYLASKYLSLRSEKEGKL